MIVSFTGHRPEEISGYGGGLCQDWVIQQLNNILYLTKPSLAISGMALGVDQWAAANCTYLNIPWIAAIPFVGQEKVWPPESQDQYWRILKNAKEVKIVSEGGYSPEKMQLRNEWMVDNSDLVIAVWNGVPKGGTANCVRYAELVKKPILRIDPREFK